MVEEGQQPAASLQTETSKQGITPHANAPALPNRVDPETDAALLLNQAQQALASIDETTSDLPSGTKPFELKKFVGTPVADSATPELIQDVALELKIELGRTLMQLEDVLQLKKGGIVTLDQLAGEPVDIYVSGRLIARGEVLVLNDNFCVRVAELIADKSAVA